MYLHPAFLLLAACGRSPDDTGGLQVSPDGYVLGSVVITPDGRTTYFQVLDDLSPEGPVTNETAVEAAGNGVLLTRGRDIFMGLAESPEWVRYSVSDAGTLSETGRMSLASYGFTAVDYGNAIVSDRLAVSVSSEASVAVMWDPETMEVLRSVDLPHLVREGYSVEVWTTLAHDGLVYIPARWSDWAGGRIYPGVSTTILDPEAGAILGVAEDDRCASGGRVLFDADGAAYVTGDGRNYSSTMFANAAGTEAPSSCILRILPGETDFDPDFYAPVPSLTGGLEAVSELESAEQGSGVAFSWMFYESELPDGVEPVDFGFWSYPVFKLWRVEVGDEPSGSPVEGMPFGVMGFEGAGVDGSYFVGLGDTETSTIYQIDPETGDATERFVMDGYFYGLSRLGG